MFKDQWEFDTLAERPDPQAFGTARAFATADLSAAVPSGTQRRRSLAVLDPSLLDRAAIERSIARFRSFAKLEDDWDGEGACAPVRSRLDEALQFLTRLQPWHPKPFATLDIDGSPVIEFGDDSPPLFGSIKFLGNDHVEMYASFSEGSESAYHEGTLSSAEALRFLSDNLQVSLHHR